MRYLLRYLELKLRVSMSVVGPGKTGSSSSHKAVGYVLLWPGRPRREYIRVEHIPCWDGQKSRADRITDTFFHDDDDDFFLLILILWWLENAFPGINCNSLRAYALLMMFTIRIRPIVMSTPFPTYSSLGVIVTIIHNLVYIYTHRLTPGCPLSTNGSPIAWR